MTDTRNKEEVYDSEIFPLMSQILEVCKTHKIAMVASFQIPTEADPNLRCTSALVADDYHPHNDLTAAKRMLYDGFVAYTTSMRTRG